MYAWNVWLHYQSLTALWALTMLNRWKLNTTSQVIISKSFSLQYYSSKLHPSCHDAMCVPLIFMCLMYFLEMRFYSFLMYCKLRQVCSLIGCRCSVSKKSYCWAQPKKWPLSSSWKVTHKLLNDFCVLALSVPFVLIKLSDLRDYLFYLGKNKNA